jgi:hypothetical protein
MCAGNTFSAGGFSLAQPLRVPGMGIVSLTDGSFVAAWSELQETVSCNAGQLSPSLATSLEVARGNSLGWNAPGELTTPGYFLYQSPALVSLVAAGTSVMAIWATGEDAGGSTAVNELIGTGLIASDSSWRPAQPLISGGPVFESYVDFAGASLAINAGGDGFVSFQQFNDAGTAEDEFVAPITAFTFGPLKDLSLSCALNVSGEEVLWGALAVDSDGGAAVVWQGAANNNVATAEIYAPANGWEGCEAIGGDGGGLSQVVAPSIADIGHGQWGLLYEFVGNTAESIDFRTLGP